MMKIAFLISIGLLQVTCIMGNTFAPPTSKLFSSPSGTVLIRSVPHETREGGPLTLHVYKLDVEDNEYEKVDSFQFDGYLESVYIDDSASVIIHISYRRAAGPSDSAIIQVFDLDGNMLKTWGTYDVYSYNEIQNSGTGISTLEHETTVFFGENQETLVISPQFNETSAELGLEKLVLHLDDLRISRVKMDYSSLKNKSKCRFFPLIIVLLLLGVGSIMATLIKIYRQNKNAHGSANASHGQ